MKHLFVSGFDSVLGRLTVISSEKGVCRVLLPGQDDVDNYDDYRLILDSGYNASILSQLDRYLKGQIKSFNCDLDLSGTEFQLKVWNYLSKIGYASTVTYKQIAVDIGCEKAQRAVGNAVAKNPIPIIIPCHRVVRKDGRIGGYSAGIYIKRYLLELEKKYK